MKKMYLLFFVIVVEFMFSGCARAQRGNVNSAGSITNGNIAVFKNRFTIEDGGIALADLLSAMDQANNAIPLVSNTDVQFGTTNGNLDLIAPGVIRLQTGSGSLEVDGDTTTIGGSLAVTGDPFDVAGVGNRAYNDGRYAPIAYTNAILNENAATPGAVTISADYLEIVGGSTGFQIFSQTPIEFNKAIDMQGYAIYNLTAPTNDIMVAARGYNDARYSQLGTTPKFTGIEITNATLGVIPAFKVQSSDGQIYAADSIYGYGSVRNQNWNDAHYALMGSFPYFTGATITNSSGGTTIGLSGSTGRITATGDPSSSVGVGNRAYNDARYAPITADPLTAVHTFSDGNNDHTVTIQNGLIQTWFVNPHTTGAEPVAYTIPLPSYYAPTNGFPAWFADVRFSLTDEAVGSGAPVIYESTKTAAANDAIIMAGTNLTTTFFVLGNSFSAVSVANATNVFSDTAVLQMPFDMVDEFAFVWPTNANGYGAPVALNKTESWWVGPDNVTRDEEFSIFGRNLIGSTNICAAYCPETEEWLTGTADDEFRVRFTIPSGWANGTYNLYPHNGQGGQYGFANPVTVTVADAYDWSAGSTVSVLTYGATGDGVTDDRTAINNAISATPVGGTTYLPAGTYAISDYIAIGSSKRLLGDGPTTIITGAAGWTNAAAYRGYLKNGADNAQIQDLCVDFGTNGYYNSSGRGIDLEGSDHTKLIGVTVIQDVDATHTLGNTVWINNCTDILVSNCVFKMRNSIYLGTTTQIHFEHNTYRGMYDNNSMVGGLGRFLSFADEDIAPYDATDPSNGRGWVKGRFFAGQSINAYFGHNTATNMCPRYDPAYSKYSQPADQNSGEGFLFEGLSPYYVTTALSTTSNTVTLTDNAADYTGYCLVIKNGRGNGQARRIVSYSAGVAVLDQNWTVEPDTNSLVAIGKYAHHIAIVGNSWHGNHRTSDVMGFTDGGSSSYTNYTATTMVSLYGGSTDCEIVDNTIKSVRTGIYVWSMAYGYGGTSTNPLHWGPTMFNRVSGNVIDDVLYGLNNVAQEFVGSATFSNIGASVNRWNLFHGNTLSGITGVAYNQSASPDSTVAVVEHVVFDQNTSGTGWQAEWAETSNVTNTIDFN